MFSFLPPRLEMIALLKKIVKPQTGYIFANTYLTKGFNPIYKEL